MKSIFLNSVLFLPKFIFFCFNFVTIFLLLESVQHSVYLVFHMDFRLKVLVDSVIVKIIRPYMTHLPAFRDDNCQVG